MNNAFFKNFVAEYGNLQSILAILVAVIAGYFFQAVYIVDMTGGNYAAARVIAVICCLSLAVMVKATMRQVKLNHRLNFIIEKHVKFWLGLILIIFMVIIDAITSNVSVDNTRVSRIAEKVAQVDNSEQLEDLRRARTRDEKQLKELDSLAARIGGIAYAQSRRELRKSISEKDVLIAQAGSTGVVARNKANQMLASTVSQESGAPKTLWGFYLMAMVIGLEIFAPVVLLSETSRNVSLETAETFQETGVTLSKTTVQHESVSLTFPRNAEGWRLAIESIVRERAAGNGKNLLSQIARYFEINKGVVSRAVACVESGQKINVPMKLLKPVN